MRTPLTAKQIASIERTLNGGTWTITFGAVLFSVLTVTPLVREVTPKGWEFTAPLLPIVVDAAVVIVVRLDGVLARLGAKGGGWPIMLRWLTGIMTLALNTAGSALKEDWVGVAVHSVAPLLLIVTAEASTAYRKAIAAALLDIEAEQARERSEREAREQAERDERERERLARERSEQAAREQAQAEERERREHAAQQAREQREYEAEQRRMEAERADRERREEREREERREERERQERAEQQRREQEERDRLEAEKRRAAAAAQAEQQRREEEEKRERERREAARREQREARAREMAVNTPQSPKKAFMNAPKQAAVNTEKLSEETARELVLNTPRASVRELADKTGWSVGWVSGVRREQQDGAEESAA